MKKHKRKRMFLIILSTIMLMGVLVFVWYGNRIKIFGQYKVSELKYIDILTSVSAELWEEQYLDAQVIITDNCIKLVDNHGQINQVKNPDYTIVQNIGETSFLQEYKTSLLQEYKELFWGTEDRFVDTIKTSYVIKQASERGSYFMVWESSEGTYLVLYTKDAKKYFASLVVKLEE